MYFCNLVLSEQEITFDVYPVYFKSFLKKQIRFYKIKQANGFENAE